MAIVCKGVCAYTGKCQKNRNF